MRKIRKIKIFTILVSVICLLAVPHLLQSQNQQDATIGQGEEIKDPESINLGDQDLYLEVMEDFENAEDWSVQSTSPIGDTKIMKLVQWGEIRSTGDEDIVPPSEEAYSLNQSPDNPNHILGVKSFFGYHGNDRVEFRPPHAYFIKGKAKQFSIWALGRGFRHSLYIKLRDYRNKIHKLHMGNLNYRGWRKLTAVVPGWLPQDTRQESFGKYLSFVSLFAVSHHHERKGDYYFYFDGLKVLIDRSKIDYPGSDIKDNW